LPNSNSALKVNNWKALLLYEEGNPLELPKDKLESRVLFFYECCLVEMYFFPEFWYLYANYFQDRPLLALDVYEKAIKALPNCVLLHCAYAELKSMQSDEEYHLAKDYLSKVAEEQKHPLLWINLIKLVKKFEGRIETIGKSGINGIGEKVTFN